jgi:peptidyl-prolyl cis-trans isomerase D
MSIIQQIREKAAWLVFGLIALSLVGFLLMDAFVGKSRLFGGNSNTIGSVNGEKLDYVDFQKQITSREDQYKAQGYPINEMMQQNIKDGVWKEFVEETVLNGVYKKAGLDVSDRELNDMLVGPNAIPDIRRSFTDAKTGIFDAQAAASTINQLRTIYKSNKKTDKNYEQARKFFEEGLPQMVQAREREKYISLIANSAYIPKWMVEKTNADNSQISSISYISTPYATIPDSTVKISEDEIGNYVDKHKEQYKQEETRSIAYVSFNAAPTSGDSAAIKQQLLNLKGEFLSSKDPTLFLARNASELGYSDSYVSKSKLQVPNKDSIMALSKGTTFGPYLDASNYVVAKKIDEKLMPDSVRARHILIATVDPQSGQATLDDSTAKKRIDSIEALIQKGERFDSLAVKFSDDISSKIKGGDLGYFPMGQMVKEFNDFCFNGKAGDQKVVKTQFGYHLIDILDQKNFEPAYKIAYLAKKIDASTETDQNASGLATQFAGESRSAKTFNDNLQKKNLQKLLAPDILPTDYLIQGLGTSRQLVRWLYDASVGDVSESIAVGDKYIVAAVTEVNKEGAMTTQKARPMVEPILRNEKKAEQIIKKIGSANTLTAVAAAMGQQEKRADSIGFSSPYIPNLGQEGKVVGYSFDKGLTGKPASEPVAGNSGVFVIKVNNVSAKANYNSDIAQARRNQEQMQRTILQRQAIESLKKTATIKDNRGKFF